ncbi:pyridoxamine 5'-phosphate oxidase family protein [Thermopolyspora sp. NPDC052614]|uniref:pyridoxamine 5'-phosphate oxidase family protein n=1 Tax=Thermopolyspora sp. NPDC052614 TaxID=3155682 RepID=UPI00344297BE
MSAEQIAPVSSSSSADVRTSDPAAAPLSPSSRTRLNRSKERARFDRAELYAVLDAGLICHLGVVVDGTPRVIPTGYGRLGDTLYLHGSTGATSLRAGGEVCVTVTHVDGIVLARSVFHHSVNYRSAMIYGVPRLVADPEEKLTGLRVLTEQLAPGQWAAARRPSAKELAATAVLALSLREASVKMRQGPPNDDEEDLARPIWAGVLPLVTAWGDPVPDPLLTPGIPVPRHISER